MFCLQCPDLVEQVCHFFGRVGMCKDVKMMWAVVMVVHEFEELTTNLLVQEVFLKVGFIQASGMSCCVLCLPVHLVLPYFTLFLVNQVYL